MNGLVHLKLNNNWFSFQRGQNQLVCFWLSFDIRKKCGLLLVCFRCENTKYDLVWFSNKPNPVLFFTLWLSIEAPLNTLQESLSHSPHLEQALHDEETQ